ncbi:MAG: UMP kinase [Anaerolinea sp.]|nr:UMP kinase [Anaerolinea sp.]MCC6973222.1 UMP kinase [Anaerolineae bacterium]
MRKPRYKRVLLKLSGEALSGVGGFGIDPDQAAFIAHRVKALHTLGVQIGIVIGAGNLWRGKDGVDRGMDQTTADHMGMIGTVMNALALRDSLERENVQSRVQTAIEMNKVAEPYIRLRTIRHLEKGRVVIIGGGTGNPYFTTDTAAALRGMEIDAELLIKATKVDGIYDSDPKKNPNAHRYESITFREAIDKRLAVMDTTAFSLCMENNLPILVIDFWAEGALEAAVMGEPIGTIVSR